jgi:hypothetical protein
LTIGDNGEVGTRLDDFSLTERNGVIFVGNMFDRRPVENLWLHENDRVIVLEDGG